MGLFVVQDGKSSAHSNTIDGLRSVAILPVIIWHAFPELLPGGYLGVDIFFVISGFLIASMIADQAVHGQFSIGDFYKRRILRIFPALFLVLVVSSIVGWLLLPPLKFREFGQALFASSIFSSNILFWLKSGYFDAAAESNPLVHTWSLAVEEQFYLVAPLIAILVAKGRNALYWFLAFGCITSLLFSGVTNDIVPSTYFFFTLNRVFELGIGGMVGCAFRSRSFGELRRLVASAPRSLIELTSAVSVLALAWSFFYFDSDTHHPGLITLVPVLATATLLLFNEARSHVNLLLSRKALVLIGLISYSLYLIHHPLLAYVRIVHVTDVPPMYLVACLILSILLAYVSWRFVETPFRHYSRFQIRIVFIGAVTVIAAGALGGLAIYINEGYPQRYTADVIQTVRPPTAEKLRYDTAGVPRNTRIVLWGDSHAKMLANDLKEWTSRTGGTVELLSNGGCPPIPGFDNDWRNLEGPRCSTHNDEVLRILNDMKPGATIVLIARWPNYLRAPDEPNEFGHRWSLASRSIFPASQEHWSDTSVQAAGRSLGSTVDQLTARGHKVILVGSVPSHRVHADDLGFLLDGNQIAIREFDTDRALFDFANTDTDTMFRVALAGVDQVTFLNPANIFCNDGRCSFMYGDRMAYKDDNHLNDWGAYPLTRAIMMGAPENQADR